MNDQSMLSPRQAIAILMDSGLTQAQVANLCGASQGTISRIRSGALVPSYVITDALRREAIKLMPVLTDQVPTQEPRRETILDRWRANRHAEVND